MLRTRFAWARRPVPACFLWTVCLFLLPSLTAVAGPVPSQGSAALERHYTTNALAGERAVADWYTLLRGSFRREWGDADANVALGATAQATRHDTVRIEDDRFISMSAQAFRRLRPGLELRGTLTYRLSSDGDDLTVGPVTLGMRTTKQTFSAQTQLGIDLGNATTLVLEAGNDFEKVGRSHFQQDLLVPTQLDPDRNRLQLGFRVAHTSGQIVAGASGSALLVTVQELGTPPVAVSFERYALRGELAWTGSDGAAAGIAAGAEFLRAQNGLYSRLRPAWQVAFKKPLSHGLELRGSYAGRFEDVDSDDPLASWLQRAEIEARLDTGSKFTLSAGLFWQDKQNLLFENRERSRGLYAESRYQLTKSTAAVLRLDMAKVFKTVLDTHENTIDVYLGWQADL